MDEAVQLLLSRASGRGNTKMRRKERGDDRQCMHMNPRSVSATQAVRIAHQGAYAYRMMLYGYIEGFWRHSGS